MRGEFLLALLLLLWLIGGPIIALVMASFARTQTRKTQAYLRDLETELRSLQQELRQLRTSGVPLEPMPESIPPWVQLRSLRNSGVPPEPMSQAGIHEQTVRTN